MSLLAGLACTQAAWAQGPTPGQNVNMVSGFTWPYGDPFLERQNEPSLAVSTRNSLHLLGGANDYRTVDLNLLESEPGENNSCPPGTLTCPGTAEPWVGQYISTDGGAHWQSTLLPGFPQDVSPQGVASPLHGFTTASDPVIRAGTNGLFYYAGIAFNRGTNNGVVFVARFMDLNNKENGNIATDSFPIRYINTEVVAHGSSTQFLDKPWIAVDIPRSGRTCTLSVPETKVVGGQPVTTNVTQTVPAGNVYVAYANIATVNGVTTSTIYFSRSLDCGQTWSTPTALSRGYALSQGATIQIDPETGIVYVCWRTFDNGTTQLKDSVVVAASINAGYSFFPGIPVVTLPPFNLNTPNGPAFFDQGTTQVTFRSAAYPAMAVADSGYPFVPGPVYFAWSQRGVGPNGAARIMMLAIPGNLVVSSSGITLPTPFPVDNLPVTDDAGNIFTQGHQWAPSMTYIEGKLMLVYYDQRLDHTLGQDQPSVSNGFFVPDPTTGKFYKESRQLEGELAANGNNSSAVFTPFISDADPPLTLRRHTIDLTLAQSDAGLGVPTFTYARVSQYDFGLFLNENDTTFHQLKVNPPGLPMFEKGKVPFMGDYIDIVGQMFVPTAKGGWAFNNPRVNSSSPVHYAAWTSNQDVIPPFNGDWTQYFPITSGTSVYIKGTNTLACQPGTGFEGDRNQNVYQSRITQGLLVSSPQNSKPLSTIVQRAFVVLVQNFTNVPRTFQLSIANQPPGSFAIANGTIGGFASFQQVLPNQPSLPTTLPTPVTTQTVTTAGHSGAASTVFALSNNPTANITVNVNEVDQNGNIVTGGLSSFILLNADGTVPALTNPDSAPQNTNITGVEIYDPGISGPGISGANANATSITSPGISGPGISGTTCGGPGISGPGISGPGISGTGCTSPGISGPGISGPGISGTAIVSPGISGTNTPAPGISGSAVSDATYTVSNTGNTTAGYNVVLVGCETAPCSTTPLQLISSQIYVTPGTDGQCNLIPVQQNTILSNNAHPVFTPANQLSSPGISGMAVSDAAFSLEPGDTALITLRGNVDVPTMQTIVGQVTPAIIPQAIDTTSSATNPPVVTPLFITTATLPDAINGQTYNPPTGISLQAIGGKPPYTWGFSGEGSFLPSGLSLSPSGVITGAPDTAAQTFQITVEVTDSSAPMPNTAFRQLSIRVATPLVVNTESPLPTAAQGTSYGPMNFSAIGGIAPYTWTFSMNGAQITSIDGLNLSNAGVLSGNPTATGTFNFTATVKDGGSPKQSASRQIILNVVPATPPTPPSSVLLCDNFNGLTVTQQVGGPPNPTTCSFSAATMITQVATYHYNSGAGDPPGTISLLFGGKTFGPSAATGVPGQSGPNEAWVATPNVILPAGTITIIDSNPATWSFNTGSNNAGFVRVWGSAIQASGLSFVTQPTDTIVNHTISPAVQVRATDSTGAPLPFIAITVSIGGSGGTLLGTTTQTTNASGIATFSDLSVNFAETYTMFATAGGDAQATSSSFMVLGWVSETAFADPRPNAGGSGTVGIQNGAASLINGKIYVSHGFRSIDSNLLSIYSVVNNSWSHDSALPTAAVARSYLGSGVANGKHYAIGGEAFGEPVQIFATVEQYDPVANTWTTMTSMPTARAGLGVASWNNLIYALGGRNGATDGQGTIFNALERFDPVSNSWTTLSAMPTAVSDISATVAYNNKIYVFGGATGFNATTNTLTVVNLLQIYDIANNTWTTGTSMPTARAAALAGVFGTHIVVFGGVDANAANLGVSEIYDPAADQWSAGPSLLTTAGEMCQGVIFDGTNVFAIGQGGAQTSTSVPVQNFQF
jgi:N-acetylneuraminic acid mutarotase